MTRAEIISPPDILSYTKYRQIIKEIYRCENNYLDSLKYSFSCLLRYQQNLDCRHKYRNSVMKTCIILSSLQKYSLHKKGFYSVTALLTSLRLWMDDSDLEIWSQRTVIFIFNSQAVEDRKNKMTRTLANRSICMLTTSRNAGGCGNHVMFFV